MNINPITKRQAERLAYNRSSEIKKKSELQLPKLVKSYLPKSSDRSQR